jgi:soluble lytic murein transglycosylase-like protein
MSGPQLVAIPRARRLAKALAAAVALLGGAADACAQIYVSASNSESSTVVLSSFVSEATPRLLLALEKPHDALQAVPLPVSAPGVRAVAARKASAEIAALVAEVARELKISPLLIHAVIAQESNFNPNAVSAKGAIGLMQLLPQTASRFGARHVFEPRDNIRAGALYLRWLADLFEDRLDLVLAAYNAGEQSVIRAGWQVPPFLETKAYVDKILARLQCEGLATCSAPAL